jgi:hypothetical protein
MEVSRFIIADGENRNIGAWQGLDAGRASIPGFAAKTRQIIHDPVLFQMFLLTPEKAVTRREGQRGSMLTGAYVTRRRRFVAGLTFFVALPPQYDRKYRRSGFR